MGDILQFPPKDRVGESEGRCAECGWKMPSVVESAMGVDPRANGITLTLRCPECESKIIWIVLFED
jgi:DNA-directed RNA polymerase subunit RPC12/RpoP